MGTLEPSALHGQRIRMEPLSFHHLPGLLAAASGPRETYALTNVPEDEPGMRRYIEVALTQKAQGLAVPFATVESATGTVVGSSRFGNMESWTWPEGSPKKRLRGVPDAVEIGWTWLAFSAQRTGINTESKLLMLEYAFETWEVHRVTFKTDARNERSRAALLRLSAHFEGVLRSHLPASDGVNIRDSAYFSLVRSEWPAVKARLLAFLR